MLRNGSRINMTTFYNKLDLAAPYRMSNDHIIIARDIIGAGGAKQYAVVDNYKELFKLIESTPQANRNFYEVAPCHLAQKFRLDIDMYHITLEEAQHHLRVILATMNEVLVERQVPYTFQGNCLVFSSHGETKDKGFKHSYHIIVDKLLHQGISKQDRVRYKKVTEPEALYLLIKQRVPESSRYFLDDSVYGTSSCLRMMFCVKATDPDRPKVLDDINVYYPKEGFEGINMKTIAQEDARQIIAEEYFRASLLTCNLYCEARYGGGFYPPFGDLIPRPVRKASLSSPQELTDLQQEIMIKAFMRAYPQVYSEFEEGDCHENKIYLKRISPGMCPVHNRPHGESRQRPGNGGNLKMDDKGGMWFNCLADVDQTGTKLPVGLGYFSEFVTAEQIAAEEAEDEQGGFQIGDVFIPNKPAKERSKIPSPPKMVPKVVAPPDEIPIVDVDPDADPDMDFGPDDDAEAGVAIDIGFDPDSTTTTSGTNATSATPEPLRDYDLRDPYYFSDYIKAYRDTYFGKNLKKGVVARTMLSDCKRVIKIVHGGGSRRVFIKLSADDPFHETTMTQSQIEKFHHLLGAYYWDPSAGKDEEGGTGPKGGYRKIPLFTFLSTHIEEFYVNGTTWVPYHWHDPAPVTPGLLNTFPGFKARKVEWKMEVMAPILNHIKRVWCRNDEYCYRYVLTLLGYGIRYLTYSGYALGIYSKQGVGKTIICENLFIALIYGMAISFTTDTLSSVSGEFNESLEHRLFYNFNELLQADAVSEQMMLGAYGKLKKYIADPLLPIHRKHKSRIMVPNFLNITVFTQHKTAFKLDGVQDRRWAILEADEEILGDPDMPNYGNPEYFSWLASHVNQEVANHLYSYFLSDEFGEIEVKVLRNIPKTAARETVIERNAVLQDAFINDLVTSRLMLPLKYLWLSRKEGNTRAVYISKDNLYKFYVAWSRENGLTVKTSKAFHGGDQLARFFSIPGAGRKTCYYFTDTGAGWLSKVEGSQYVYELKPQYFDRVLISIIYDDPSAPHIPPPINDLFRERLQSDSDNPEITIPDLFSIIGSSLPERFRPPIKP